MSTDEQKKALINHLGAGAAGAGGLYAAGGLDTDPGADTLPADARGNRITRQPQNARASVSDKQRRCATGRKR